MPDLTLAVAAWWVGTCVACLLLGIGLGSLWASIRRTGESLRDVAVAERIATAKAGRVAGAAAVMRPDGTAQTNLMMSAVDSPLPGLLTEPVRGVVPDRDELEQWIVSESPRDPAFASALAEVEAAQVEARELVETTHQAVVAVATPELLEPDPDDPWDVEIVGVEDDPPKRPGPPPRLDDGDGPGRPPTPGEVVVPTITIGPVRRYAWKSGDPDAPVLSGRPVIPSSWAGWVRRVAVRFRRRRPDVRAVLWLLGLWPPLHHWLVRLLAASVHKARHAARTGAVSWSDNAHLVTERLELEWQTRAEQLRIRLEQAERRTTAWRIEVGLMMDALKPPRRTIPPTLPSLGCTP